MSASKDSYINPIYATTITDTHRSSPMKQTISNMNINSHKTFSNLEMENEMLAKSNKLQADKLTDMYGKSDNLTHKLITKEKDNELKESKILNQEKDIEILARNLDDKNKN